MNLCNFVPSVSFVRLPIKSWASRLKKVKKGLDATFFFLILAINETNQVIQKGFILLNLFILF